MPNIERTSIFQSECPECGEATSRRHSCTTHNVSYRAVEYVRADLHQGVVAEAQRLREALRQIMYAPIDTSAADMAEIASDAFNATEGQ